MAEVEEFAKDAIRNFTGLGAEGRHPLRAGDISFNNLGISTFFMLSSTMPAALRQEKGYAVGGCGGNVAWHAEADIDVADRDRLLRDIRLYTGSAFRAANRPVHPLDFRATVAQIEDVLGGIGERTDGLIDLSGTSERAQSLRSALDGLDAAAGGIDSAEAARPVNDALLKIGRALVRVLYSKGRCIPPGARARCPAAARVHRGCRRGGHRAGWCPTNGARPRTQPARRRTRRGSRTGARRGGLHRRVENACSIAVAVTARRCCWNGP